VTITQTATGAEYRKLVHPYPVRRFHLIFRESLASLWADVVNLYHRAYGRFSGFRAKAFDDFTTATDGRSAPTMTDQATIYVSPRRLSAVQGLRTGCRRSAYRPAVPRHLQTGFGNGTGRKE
jgi:hypothetical protein